MHQCEGARALDLFAGSGALGLECLSRGAAHVDFVEKNKGVARQIESNLRTLEVINKAKVWSMSHDAFIQRQKKQIDTAYDLIFLDPPFADGLLLEAIEHLEAADVLADDAYIYLEFSSQQSIEYLPENWHIYRQGKAGQSRFHLYQRVVNRTQLLDQGAD